MYQLQKDLTVSGSDDWSEIRQDPEILVVATGGAWDVPIICK